MFFLIFGSAIVAGTTIIVAASTAQEIVDTNYAGGPILTIKNEQPTVEAFAAFAGSVAKSTEV